MSELARGFDALSTQSVSRPASSSGSSSSVLLTERGLMPQNLEGLIELARLYVEGGLARHGTQPAEAVVAMELGISLGLTPAQSLQSIAVINGRLTLWGDGMLAVVLACDACEGVEETYDPQTQTATCVARRRGRPPLTRSFSAEDARRAKLWNRPTYQQYPQRMLAARARSWALRDQFADCIRGLMAREELDDVQDAEVISTQPQWAEPGRREPLPLRSEDDPGRFRESGTAPASAELVERIKKTLRQLQVPPEKAAALVKSVGAEQLSELSDDQAKRFLTRLEGKLSQRQIAGRMLGSPSSASPVQSRTREAPPREAGPGGTQEANDIPS